MAKNTIVMPKLAAVKRGFLKKCTSSIGWSVCASHERNPPSTAKPSAMHPRIVGSLQPCCGAETASLVQPAGLYGASFLATKNYFAIKEYNFSDLYVLFVGHLSDRIGDPRPFETPWSTVVQLPTADLDRMQRVLTARGYYHDKIDGKAGMLTRAALGDYQKRNGLKVDCWPSAAVLRQMEANGR